jgi:hypothetical protein
VDCSKFQTQQCEVAVCNTGQVMGAPLNTCVVTPAPDGTTCDDGVFCTVSDFCNKGTCVGGVQNDCGFAHDSCNAVICYESSKTCTITPVNDGTACAPKDLCQVDGVCKNGNCAGVPKDCSNNPLNECNAVTCDKSSGDCVAMPDTNKNGNPCMFTGDLCTVDKACLAGQCVGGKPKDCSQLDIGCQIGVCNTMSGVCGPAYAPVGTVCTHGLQACQTGMCDVKGVCVGSTAPNGTACNDHDACTQGDTCTAGACGGTPVTGCHLYLAEGFETCPDGWTLMGDWQCGAPMNVGPASAHSGNNCIATQIAGNYHNNQTFDMCTADSPPIDLTTATSPQVLFWAWVDTEGGIADGWNMKISIDGGANFQEVMSPVPMYPLTIFAQPSWGGDHSAQGWQPYSADLTAYAGHSVILRFAFHSDATNVFPGVYIDDLVVAEPLEIPLYITTTSPLGDAYVGKYYSTQLTKVGGTSSSKWSFVGSHPGWLFLDTASGLLYGTPGPNDVMPVSITVQVQEPALPSNFDQATFTFNVKPDLYYTGWEGTCPDGWTLLGDWKCGVPMTVGPPTAYDGTQCIGTGMGQLYSPNDTWAATTATSPKIDLTNAMSPTLTFRMWVDTEGGTLDGANLQVSTDGTTFTVLNAVTPVYPLMIAGEPAWGGTQSALGWQLVQADLTAYAGMHIYLRFAFQSDSSNEFAGVFIDDFLVE